MLLSNEPLSMYSNRCTDINSNFRDIDLAKKGAKNLPSQLVLECESDLNIRRSSYNHEIPKTVVITTPTSLKGINEIATPMEI